MFAKKDKQQQEKPKQTPEDKKIERKNTDEHYGVITAEQYTNMKNHFMKIATRPAECNPDDFKEYDNQKLADYIFAEMLQGLGQHRTEGEIEKQKRK